ncbi:hypothetical protein KC19_VG246900 [Ceratodon purpureus]|uniref:Uncharacterized protein n=1 Tax=Ceratodon purpureus TaxID=3225 RepID=A0A8T0HT74_CERPU|nr:hypothetical protein KC19_VG246900 [Ceratodon purpureus]
MTCADLHSSEEWSSFLVCALVPYGSFLAVLVSWVSAGLSACCLELPMPSLCVRFCQEPSYIVL